MSRVFQLVRQTLAIGALVAVAGVLGSCGDAHSRYSLAGARDVNGTAVDPSTGIPLPGASVGNHGM